MCGKNFLSPLYKEKTVQLLSTLYTNRVSKVFLNIFLFSKDKLNWPSDIKTFTLLKKIM